MSSLGAEGWTDVLRLLKEQDEKMARLARALSIIQQSMLRNNPRHVTDSVNEATEVLGGKKDQHALPLRKNSLEGKGCSSPPYA